MVGAFSLTSPTAMQISLERKKAFTGTPIRPPFWHINLADVTLYENPLYPQMTNALSNL